MLRKLSSIQLLVAGFLTPTIIGALILGTVVLARSNTKTASGDHVRGNPKASITIEEYSDFECPFCGQYYPIIKQVLANYSDKVRFVYKHFPLNFHPQAQKAAEASECAGEQGKFWEMHDKIFENQSGLSIEGLKRFATELRLNSQKFNTCLDSGKYAEKVRANYQEGVVRGVE